MKSITKTSIQDIDQQIENGFASNAQKNKALNDVQRAFNDHIDKINTYYLDIPVKQRTSAQTYIYYQLPEIHLWRPNHSEMVRINFHQALDDVDAIDQLVELKNNIKNTNIIARIECNKEPISPSR